MNLVILHRFDFPAGMATTKRYNYFADYFKRNNWNVTYVLKINDTQSGGIEKGTIDGVNYYKVFPRKNHIYPFYFDKFQNTSILKILDEIYNINTRNIIITGGLTPEFFPIIKIASTKWELYFDYLEDYLYIGSNFNKLKRISLYSFLKAKITSALLLPFFWLTEKYMFRKAKGISAISPHLFEKASKSSKEVIFLPVNTISNVNYDKVKFNNPVTILYAGNAGLKDNIELIIISFTRLSAKFNICLKICGKLTVQGETIIKKSASHLNKIKLLGYLSDEEYYHELRNADILLMTRTDSNYSNAGFPYKLGEYLATSNPVIASKVSGVEMFLENNKNALLVKPDCLSDLEEAIRYLIVNQERAISIGKEGYKVFLKHFQAEENSKKLYDFILNPYKLN
jgi:glycosyltransferase involved in cell wall biosynthesis